MEKYPIEFKLEIINQINKGVLSVDEAAHKYHVNRTSVRKWLNVFNLHGAEGLTKPKFIYSGDFKLAVGETVADHLKPLQERYEQLMKDKAYIESMIKQNDEKAAYYANKTLRKVQKKVGLTERIR